jgi:hypothetical protein
MWSALVYLEQFSLCLSLLLSLSLFVKSNLLFSLFTTPRSEDIRI